MGSILLGVALGVLLGLALFGVCMLIKMEVSCSRETLLNVIGTIVLIACTIGGGFTAGVIEQYTYESYVAEYNMVKATIEDSINTDNLSGFERVALVNTATIENAKLAKNQYKANQWYGFLVTDEILELEPIDLEG